MQPKNKNISEAFSQGDFKAAYEHFADDIQWRIIGDKTLTGKENTIEFCDKMLADMGSSKLTNTVIISEEDNIAIEGYCSYTNKENQEACVEYCDVYHFENGKIKTIVSYCIDSAKKQ